MDNMLTQQMGFRAHTYAETVQPNLGEPKYRHQMMTQY